MMSIVSVKRPALFERTSVASSDSLVIIDLPRRIFGLAGRYWRTRS